jgi:hypothetical protein
LDGNILQKCLQLLTSFRYHDMKFLTRTIQIVSMKITVPRQVRRKNYALWYFLQKFVPFFCGNMITSINISMWWDEDLCDESGELLRVAG